MGVGLRLKGTHEPGEAEERLRRIEAWFDEDLADDPVWGHLLTRCRLGRTFDGSACLFVKAHPSSEDVEFRAVAAGELVVSAKTSIAGAGYHTALCQILRRLGQEQGIDWLPPGDDGSIDDTGYFFGGTRQGVEDAMTRHLAALTRIVEQTIRKGHDGLALGMPIDHAYHGGPIKTPVGLRDAAWLTRVAQDPRNGLDLFPWWDDGLGATFYLGRALTDLWMNVRWVEPEPGSDRWDATEGTLSDLCRAYELDPTLNFPWREWAELYDLLGRDEDATSETVRAFAAEAADGPRIGYRRHPVDVGLVGGWRIVVPGAMEEKWDEGKWSAWGEGRAVWFTCWEFGGEAGGAPTAAEMLQRGEGVFEEEGERLRHAAGPLQGRAMVRRTEEDGERLWHLRGLSAVAGKLALVNLYDADEEAGRERVVEQWRSLSNMGAKGA